MKSAIKKAYRRYLLDAMSAMALGLFSSLIIGLILAQLAKIPGLGFLAQFASVLGASSPVVGAAIGVAIAYGLKSVPLAMFSSAATGALGYQLGGPVAAYLAAVVGAELGTLIAGKTKVDIIAVPIVTIVAGGLVSVWSSPGILNATQALQRFLEMATTLQPVPMGIIISVIFGLVLTAPISSAALAAMIFTVPEGQAMGLGLMLAAGAATVGCCCHMVGFAVSSYRENKVAGLIAQGLGTSMLQVGNILVHPAILIPPTLASAILGPLATTIFQMKNASASAGMGTSGLVGPIGVYTGWLKDIAAGTRGALTGMDWAALALICFILPAVICWFLGQVCRRIGWIREGDLKL